MWVPLAIVPPRIQVQRSEEVRGSKEDDSESTANMVGRSRCRWHLCRSRRRSDRRLGGGSLRAAAARVACAVASRDRAARPSHGR